MQNRYVGDIGDFAKYGLLRVLCGIYPAVIPRLRLGIVWYLVDDESHTGDGRHIDYLLGKNDLATCDEGLYSTLRRIVAEGKRDVSSIEGTEILGSRARGEVRFYSQPLVPKDRKEWLVGAVSATADCELIFLDPDNGIATQRIDDARHRGEARKHVIVDELIALRANGASLVVIHHFDRSCSHTEQMMKQRTELQERLGVDTVYAVEWKAISKRVFFIIPGNGKGPALAARLEVLELSSWGKYFTVLK